MGCQFEQIITRSATFTKKQLVKLISDVLSKENNSQYQLVLEKFNNVFSSISRLTEDAKEHIREMQEVRKRPSAIPPSPSPADHDHDQDGQIIPTVNFSDQVFSFVENIKFEDLAVAETLSDLDVDQPAFVAAKYAFTDRQSTLTAQ